MRSNQVLMDIYNRAIKEDFYRVMLQVLKQGSHFEPKVHIQVKECGGYAYSILDGNDSYIVVSCYRSHKTYCETTFYFYKDFSGWGDHSYERAFITDIKKITVFNPELSEDLGIIEKILKEALTSTSVHAIKELSHENL